MFAEAFLLFFMFSWVFVGLEYWGYRRMIYNNEQEHLRAYLRHNQKKR